MIVHNLEQEPCHKVMPDLKPAARNHWIYRAGREDLTWASGVCVSIFSRMQNSPTPIRRLAERFHPG
jgi:hypothetical protein